MFLAYTNYNITQAASGERQGAAGGLAPSSRGASRGDVTWVLGQTVSIEPTLEHPARSTEGLVSNHPILAHQGNLRGLPKHLSLAFPRLLSTCSHQAQLFKVRVLQFSSSSSAWALPTFGCKPDQDDSLHVCILPSVIRLHHYIYIFTSTTAAAKAKRRQVQARSCSYTLKLLSRDLSSPDKPVAVVSCVLPKGTKSAVTLSSADRSMLEFFFKALSQRRRAAWETTSLSGSLLYGSIYFSSPCSVEMSRMHENVAMLLNGGVKAALTFMGIRSFAKNGCLSSPPGTVSYFGGNRGSCREWSEQAAGRIVPSWQRPGKDGGAGGARWLMPQALQGLRPAAAWGPYPGTDTHIDTAGCWDWGQRPAHAGQHNVENAGKPLLMQQMLAPGFIH